MRSYTATVDLTVICSLCAGNHLAKLCTFAAPILALVPDELPEYKPHGTLASALRERRAGGSAAMCPPCKEAWNTDQRKHRANRRARGQR